MLRAMVAAESSSNMEKVKAFVAANWFWFAVGGAVVLVVALVS